MSALFQFGTSRETKSACLGIIERAAARVARGESAVLGEVKHRAKGPEERKHNGRPPRAIKGKARGGYARITDAIRSRVTELWWRGRTIKEPAAAAGCGYSTVTFLMRGVDRPDPRRTRRMAA